MDLTKLDPLYAVNYQWKVPVVDEDGIMLLTPWSDPKLYEFPFNMIFPTPDAARDALEEFGVEPEESSMWVLVRVTTEIFDAMALA